eukprot:80042_1
MSKNKTQVNKYQKELKQVNWMRKCCSNSISFVYVGDSIIVQQLIESKLSSSLTKKYTIESESFIEKYSTDNIDNRYILIVDGYLRKLKVFIPQQIVNLVLFMSLPANVWNFKVPIDIMRNKDERSIQDVVMCLKKNDISKEAVDKFEMFCRSEKYKFIDFEINLTEIRNKFKQK